MLFLVNLLLEKAINDDKLANFLIIPALGNTKLPPKEDFEGVSPLLVQKYNDIEEAEWADDYYGCAWRQSEYRAVLGDFLRDGTVQKDWRVPNR